MAMTLLVDNFAEQLGALTVGGWVITEYSRYDPTVVVGVTPTGKAFRLECVGDAATITVAGRTKTVARAKELWEQGDLTVSLWLASYNSLPASQR